MNSKLRDALHTFGTTYYVLTKEERSKALDEAEKAIRQAVGEEMLEIIDGLEVDMEATEKHIRKAMAGSSEDDIAYQLMSASLDADDRKDTLDDVRQKIKQWQGGEDE